MSEQSSSSSGALQRSPRLHERMIKWGLCFCALISIATTLGIIFILFREAIAFFQYDEVSLTEFFTGTRWTPLFETKHFGILPLVSGTLLITLGSSIIALPVGVAAALYLSEYASSQVRSVIKPALEILAGIPTVVYGYFALTSVTPALRWTMDAVFGPGTVEVGVYNAASASIVVGIMILPMVASLSEDALQAVPDSMRRGAYALGATPFEVSTRVVAPAALSGILSSFILGISRAIGETMAVTLAAGSTPNMTMNPFESIQTMTAYIVQVSSGDAPTGTVVYQTLFAVGALLFVITFVMNLLSQIIRQRFRETYE